MKKIDTGRDSEYKIITQESQLQEDDIAPYVNKVVGTQDRQRSSSRKKSEDEDGFHVL